MALHEMAVKAIIQGEASFQVNEGASFPAGEVGFLEGFIDGSYPVATVVDFFYGKTSAAMGDALVDFKGSGIGDLIQKVVLDPDA